jgi:hypothetical protein
MVRLLLVMVPLLALVGCRTENKAFCEDPMHAGSQGCPIDASNGGTCVSDSDCCKMTSFPACDTAINHGTCEPCTASNRGVCTGTMPRCEKNTCVACVDDAQDCQGGVCLTTGACADTATIIHAASNSTKTTGCGDPGNPCSLPGALALVGPSKNIIKLDDASPFTGNGGITVAVDVTIDARVATLSRSDNGPVMTVMGGKTITLLGGVVHGAAGKMGDGIKCSGNGTTLIAFDTRIETNDLTGITSDTCALNLTRVTITNNSQKAGTFVAGINVNMGSIMLSQSKIDSNNGGGLSIMNSVFQIVGNVFSNNGLIAAPPPSPVGGISITTTGDATNRLDFNTIIGNHAQTGIGPGLQCTAGGLLVRNNIIWNNNENLVAQFLGNCQPTYSDLGFLTVDMFNNTHADPGFGTAPHLSSTSALLGKADPASDLTGIASRDVDGEPRVKRTGMGADIGADQYYPPQ